MDLDVPDDPVHAGSGGEVDVGDSGDDFYEERMFKYFMTS